MNHPDQEIELYALGILEPEDAERFEEHLRTCADCEGRLRAASETLVALDDRVSAFAHARPVPIRARSRSRLIVTGAIAALAASIAVAFGIGNARLSRTLDADDGALAAIITSHFLHVPFTPLRREAPAGKLLFPRDGAWAYAVIASNAQGLVLVRIRNRTAVTSLPLIRHRTTETAFDAHAARGDRYELRDGTGARLDAAVDDR